MIILTCQTGKVKKTPLLKPHPVLLDNVSTKITVQKNERIFYCLIKNMSEFFINSPKT